MADDPKTPPDLLGKLGTIGEVAAGLYLADRYNNLLKGGLSPKQALSALKKLPEVSGGAKVFGPIGAYAAIVGETSNAAIVNTPEAYGKAAGSIVGGIAGSALAVGAGVAVGLISAPISVPALAIGTLGSLALGTSLGTVGGWLGKYFIGNSSPPPISNYNAMGDFIGFPEEPYIPDEIRKLKNQAPERPKLSFTPQGSDRDKTLPPGGAPSGTPLSFTPPAPSAGKAPPPAWARPSLPLSMGTPVSERDRPPVGPTWPVGQPVPGIGPVPAPKGNLKPTTGGSGGGGGGGGWGGGSGGGGGGGGGSGGSGSGSGSGGGGYVNNGNNPG
ncbi:MAG: hypothetical protein IN818_09940, partial [Cutibacterium sp.]|nr:hypothetical protein [Cutibacterium sp.]